MSKHNLIFPSFHYSRNSIKPTTYAGSHRQSHLAGCLGTGTSLSKRKHLWLERHRRVEYSTPQQS